MKGILWKYDASDDKFLRDKGDCSDPDFCCNTVPVWAVCAPYVRKNLHPNDIIFFIPQKKMTNFRGYICTGVLVVEAKVEDASKIHHNSKLSARYVRVYKSDLREHRRKAKEKNKMKTRDLLAKNFIIGNRKKSYWFGSKGRKLDPILKKLGLKRIRIALPKGRNQLVPHLSEAEANRLYREIVRNASPTSPSAMRRVSHQLNIGQSCSHFA